MNPANRAKPLILVGAAGHAQVIADLILSAGGCLLGVVDRHARAGEWHFGIRLLGDDVTLATHPPSDVDLALGIGAMPGRAVRAEVQSRLAALGYSFPLLLHPWAYVARETRLEAGVQIMAGAVVQPGCRIGAHAIVNTGARIDHGCDVAEHAHIAPGAVLCADARIGEHTHVGPGAVIARGIRIGAGAVIGAGASVVRDIPPGARVLPAALRIST